jgi:curved DNA-binding protein
MSMVNYYQILGLESSCTIEDIKKAYKVYAKKVHPDLHSNDTFFKERFQEVQLAYEILADSSKRRKYDNEFFNKNSSNDSANNNLKKEKQVNEHLRKQLDEERAVVENLRSTLNQEQIKYGHLIKEHEELRRKNITLENKQNRKKISKLLISNFVGFIISIKVLLFNNRYKFLGLCLAIISLYSIYIVSKPKPVELIVGIEYSKLKKFEAKGQWTKIILRVDSSLRSGSVIDTNKIYIYGTSKNYIELEKADLIFMRAYAKQVIQNDTGAIKDYDTAINMRHKPNTLEYSNRGLLRLKFGNRDAAYLDFNKALELNPANFSARKSRVYMRLVAK